MEIWWVIRWGWLGLCSQETEGKREERKLNFRLSSVKLVEMQEASPVKHFD